MIQSQQDRLQELHSEISAYRSDIKQKLRLQEKERLKRILSLQANYKIKKQQTNQINLILENNDVVAPVSGAVTELSIYSTGVYISLGEILMKIVPKNAMFEVNAVIPDKDIGFISHGQDVTIKVDAYDFTKYGPLKGKIIHLSQDIQADEEFGSGYKSRFTIDWADSDGSSTMALSSGMKVMADVNTGTRHLIDFVLAPLQRMGNE